MIGWWSKGRAACLCPSIKSNSCWTLIGDQNRENRETIERFGHVRVIGEIPKLPNLHRTALMQVFMNHFDRAAFAQ